MVNGMSHCDYTGVDLEADRIHWAKRRFGENDKRRFLQADICRTDLPSKNFDKAVAFGLLHHLPDEAASRCVQELTRLVKKKIVFLDGVYTAFHIPNNILCKLDQGKYVRQADAYLSIVAPHVPKVDSSFYYAYSGVAKYFMMTCHLNTTS